MSMSESSCRARALEFLYRRGNMARRSVDLEQGSYRPLFWSRSLGVEVVVSNSANFLAVSITISIRRCNLFFRSAMFTLSVTRYALPTRST